MATSDAGQNKATHALSELSAPVEQTTPSGKKGWISFLIIVILAGGGYYYYRSQYMGESKAAPAPRAGGRAGAGGPVSVAVAPALKQDVPYYLSGLGSVTPFNTVTVKTRVDGQLQKVYFKEGQFVHEGDL